MNVLILGAGYSGTAIASALSSLATSVTGTTRSAEKLARLQAAGIRPILFDGAEISDELEDAMRETTHLVQSIAPGRDGDPMFRAGTPPLADLLPRLEWVGYLSTVGVYGDHGGAWVTEDTPLNPVSQRSLERVEAENAWLEHGAQHDIPVAVLRLAGIYGPGRTALVDRVRSGKPVGNEWTNRIHVDDAAAAIVHLMTMASPERLYIGVDREPARIGDVADFLADRLGVAHCLRTEGPQNKRLSCGKLVDTGFTHRFPDFRSGYAALV